MKPVEGEREDARLLTNVDGYFGRQPRKRELTSTSTEFRTRGFHGNPNLTDARPLTPPTDESFCNDSSQL